MEGTKSLRGSRPTLSYLYLPLIHDLIATTPEEPYVYLPIISLI